MNVTPCCENNAIKKVAFAFHFQKAFTLGELSALKSLHKGDDDDLPGVQEHKAVMVQFNSADDVQAAPQQGISGLTFQKVKPNGKAEWSFTIEDQK